MPSHIKVDEIKNVAGQYEIKTNTFKGQTTGGSIAVQGEGTATTNLQQGLNKQWIAFNMNGTIGDSFNTTSITPPLVFGSIISTAIVLIRLLTFLHCLLSVLLHSQL